MRQRNKSPDSSFSPLFRNTKSKLYKRKSSFQQEDQSSVDHKHAENSSQFWKSKGNKQFKLKNFDKAIQFYSKAIEINPGESQYYSNRSKCYQKKWMLDKSLKDAEAACELDEDNIKAHYICGCILAEMSKKDHSKSGKALNRLKKALRLCRTCSARQFQEQISIKLFRLKKLSWLKTQQKELLEIELEKKLLKISLDRFQITEQQYTNMTDRLTGESTRIKEAKQIPDHLICKITLMLMEEPVISEEGFSYERKVLEEHYRLKGPVEPITRKEVTGKIFANHALKQAIDLFLKDNPWAFQEQKSEDYHGIIFV